MLHRLQKMICLLAVALLVASTMTPAMAKTVTAKVNSSSAKVYKKATRSSKSVKLKKGLTLKVTGVSGSWARVKLNGRTGYMPKKYLSTTSSKSSSSSKSKKSSKSWKSKVVKMNWFKGGSNVLKKGHYGTIYDIDTGISLRIKRMGGHYHADVEPATAADTAKLKRVAGGHFSWGSEAVILKAGGKYVACGINTRPHGDQTIYNNHYDGQFCLHMSGSMTHASSKENSHHQSSIDRAYRWAHR
jgi:hypothetical protein